MIVAGPRDGLTQHSILSGLPNAGFEVKTPLGNPDDERQENLSKESAGVNHDYIPLISMLL
jgi:hypothetical protein